MEPPGFWLYYQVFILPRSRVSTSPFLFVKQLPAALQLLIQRTSAELLPVVLQRPAI